MRAIQKVTTIYYYYTRWSGPGIYHSIWFSKESPAEFLAGLVRAKSLCEFRVFETEAELIKFANKIAKTTPNHTLYYNLYPITNHHPL